MVRKKKRESLTHAMESRKLITWFRSTVTFQSSFTGAYPAPATIIEVEHLADSVQVG